MKPTPTGWPRIASDLFYEDARAAIQFLVDAFGFEVRILLDAPNGQVAHSELTIGEDGLIMVGQAGGPTSYRRAPGQIDGGNTQTLCIFVDDVDAHCKTAVNAGGTIFSELATVDHGEGMWIDRLYGVTDPQGHHWWFVQRLKTY